MADMVEKCMMEIGKEEKKKEMEKDYVGMETCMKDVIWFKIRKREIYIFIKLVKSI
jgi:hypothetical protein